MGKRTRETPTQQQSVKKTKIAPIDADDTTFKVYVTRIVNQRKSFDKVEKVAKKYITRATTASSDSDNDSDDDEEVVKAVAKHPIAFSTQLSEDCPFQRYIFYKKHFGVLKEDSASFTSSFNQELLKAQDQSKQQVKQEDKETDDLEKERSKNLTLFMTNVHYNSSPEELTLFFDKYFNARVNKTVFSDLIKQQQQQLEKGDETIVLNGNVNEPFSDVKTNHFLSCGTVHVVLNETDKFTKILCAPELNQVKKFAPFIEDTDSATGFTRYQTQFEGNIIAADRQDTVAEQINQWMVDYDKAEKEEEALIEALRGKPDEDGWTKVVAPKGKRHLPPLHADDILKRNEAAAAKRPKKFKDEVKLTLYKHQKEEQRKKEVEKLREKFENDKRLIEKMKDKKQFKPY